VNNWGLLKAAEYDDSFLSQAHQESDLLKQRLFNPLLAQSVRTFRVRRHCNVYTYGDVDPTLYWIQSGYIKLIVNSNQGKECILNILSPGDFFGESCLAGFEFRVETATAMENATLKSITCKHFIAELSQPELVMFAKELTHRNCKQQMLIADMVTMSSEFRLARSLLRLGSRLGKKQSSGTVIDCRISQDELSCIVGTTRPRISAFMAKFRRLGLIYLNPERQIILAEAKLMAYLSSLA